MDLAIEMGYSNKIIAGVDEVGRGALAGPVIAAAVIIDQSNLISGIKDSKLIPKRRHRELYYHITNNYCWAIGIVEPLEIDQINILQATRKACLLAVQALNITPDIVLIDGNMQFPDSHFISIIRGDNKSLSIAAASIVAKFTRDQIMCQLGRELPIYDWANNCGYGTKKHIQALEDYGLSQYHRRTFRPCSEYDYSRAGN
jgi:ribonuclease HII